MLRVSGDSVADSWVSRAGGQFEDEGEEGALAVNCVSGGRMEEARRKSIDFAEKAY